MPNAALIEVLECPTPKASYLLSWRAGNGARPPGWRMVNMRSRRPVRILVGIGLVPDVPDQPIFRSIEHIVQRHGQLDHTEPGTEMAAGLAHRVEQKGPQARWPVGPVVIPRSSLTSAGTSI